MGITVNLNIDPASFLTKVGLAEADAKKIASKYKIAFGANVMKFALDGEVKHIAAVTADNAKKFYEGSLTPAAASTVKASVTQALASVLNQPTSTLHETVTDPTKLVPQQGIGEALAGHLGVKPAVAPAPSPGGALATPNPGSFFPPEKMGMAPTKKLANATMVYEPVEGTSAGSRYFCVAISENGGIRVACKYVTGTLSVRFEGPQIAAQASKLAEMGASVKAGYASVHLEVNTPALASKTLGALLLGLDLKIVTPLPHFPTLVKYGK